MNLTMADLMAVPHARSRNVPSGGLRFTGVSTDTRSVRRGNLFFALRGERFDGNRFVAEAFRKGAAAAVVDTAAGVRGAGRKPVVVVKDAVKALGALAGIYRSKFRIPIVAVAGSNGKTTTKEMIATTLRRKYRVLSTEGNLNNHVGVPATLFRLRPGHEAAVVELGTNHFGEVRSLARIAMPTHGLLTNIGSEHLQYFRNLAGVARAEGELFEQIARSGGTALVNADDVRVARIARAHRPQAVTYGFTAGTVRGRGRAIGRGGEVRFTVKAPGRKPFEVRPGVPGRHAASNALAAAAVGLTLGVAPRAIASALAEFRAVGKRMEMLTAGGVTILNDTYNANPESVITALETLGLFRGGGRRIVALGDMLELGRAAGREHRRIGAEIRKRGLTDVLAYGPMAAKYIASAGRGRHYLDKAKLASDILGMARPGDVVLVKGSRGMKMEEVVALVMAGLRRAA